MKRSTKISVVLPVRDGENRITARVQHVLEAIAGLTREIAEVVVVDDGSRDATPEVMEEIRSRYPQVRVARHSRPRGMEAAGQTGLERATGELVFIQESDSDVRIEDLQRLLKMSEDRSVVAARAESRPQPLSPQLLRRLRAWGATASEPNPQPEQPTTAPSCLQMVRRPHLQRLTGNAGKKIRLESETMRSTSIS
ncbi:glycosyltransferase family 2 protein [Novipirellula artificiosorum]|uniref:Putative glycosyltransferase n=1 Tax=Novipirellula artificiosorum TaxID=2528016 RepID=A0A5C6E101_9BACT|nr:glycosyltransferase [Novipirellula artificiosorum]TWU42395.1 putative glycosyltransferase [Novipirellula artificiosorum]